MDLAGSFTLLLVAAGVILFGGLGRYLTKGGDRAAPKA